MRAPLPEPMPQPLTFHIPFAAPTLHCWQEPKTASDRPAPSPGTPGQGPVTPGQPNAPTGGQPAGLFDNSMFLFMMLFVVLMLFLSMRRDSKAKKEQAAMLASIKAGDRIVTHFGMHAVVHRIDERTVTLLLDAAPVVFERTAIARVVRDGQPAEAKKA